MADIKYIITVDSKTAQVNIEKFDGAVKNLGTTTAQKTTPALGGLWKQFAIGVIAADAIKKSIGVLTGFMKDAVSQAAAQELAEKNLADAFAITGRNVDDLMPKFKNFANAIQSETTYSDNAVLSASALIAQLSDLDEQGLKKATKSAIGMASVFKVDLQSAATSVAKAMAGNYDMLSRYLPKLRDLKTEEEKHAYAMQEMTKWYERARGETDTFSGSLKQLGLMWDDVKKAVGRAVTENKDIRELINKIKGDIVDLIKSGKFKEWVETLGQSISILTQLFEGLYTDIKLVIDISGQLPTLAKISSEFYKQQMDYVKVLAAWGKAKAEEFQNSLSTLKIPLERLREEMEKGEKNWQDYTTRMRELDEKMLANKDTIVGWIDKGARFLGLVKDTKDGVKHETDAFAEETKKLKEKLLVIDTIVPKHRDFADALAQVADKLSDEAYGFYETLPPARDFSDLVGRMPGELNDFGDTAETVTRETKNYFDGLYNDIATGFANTIENWLSGAATFKDFMLGLWGDIKSAFFRMIGEMVATEVLKQFTKLFSSIGKQAVDTMQDAAKEAVKGVTEITKGASEVVSGLWTGLGAAVGTFLGTFLGGLGGPSGHQQQQQINDTKDSRNFLAEIRNWFYSAGSGFGGASYEFITGHIGDWLGWINDSINIQGSRALNELKIIEGVLRNIPGAQYGAVLTRPGLVMTHGTPAAPEFIIPNRGFGGSGQRLGNSISVHINGPLVATSGLSRVDLEKAGEEMYRIIKRQASRAGREI